MKNWICKGEKPKEPKPFSIVFLISIWTFGIPAQTILSGRLFPQEIQRITEEINQGRYAQAYALAREIVRKSEDNFIDSEQEMKLRCRAADDHEAAWGLIGQIYRECKNRDLMKEILAVWNAKLNDRPFLFLQLRGISSQFHRDFLSDRLWLLISEKSSRETFVVAAFILSIYCTMADIEKLRTIEKKIKNNEMQNLLSWAISNIQTRQSPYLENTEGPSSSPLSPDFKIVVQRLKKKN